jgi:SAM-dependent methyltransferase
MLNIKPSKSLSKIIKEWDAIARARDEQIATGKDHSATKILGPAILESTPDCQSIIDIGCGTGWLTEQLTRKSKLVVGIDPSSISIAIAVEQHLARSIEYTNASIEDYSQEGRKFSTAVANMSASCSNDLMAFCQGARAVLKKNSPFIITIPHPCFWPLYWGYASHPEFDYNRSSAIETEFKIQAESTEMITTHFHHPLANYLSALSSSGFAVDSLLELSGKGYNMPRFMLIKARAR